MIPIEKVIKTTTGGLTAQGFASCTHQRIRALPTLGYFESRNQPQVSKQSHAIDHTK